MKEIIFSNNTFVFLVIISCFNSCAYEFYTPPEPNVVMLSDKGEGKVTLGGGSDDGDFSFNVESAYSPIKYLGLAVNYFQVNERGKKKVERLLEKPVLFLKELLVLIIF